MLAVAQCFRILYFDDNDDVDPFVLGIFSLVASAIFCVGALKVKKRFVNNKSCSQVSVALSQVEALARGGENRVVAETIFVLGLSSNNLSTSSSPSDMHTSRDSSTKVPPENARKSYHNVVKYCECPITRYLIGRGTFSFTQPGFFAHFHIWFWI